MAVIKTHAHEGTTGATANGITEGYDVVNGSAATYVAGGVVGSTSIRFPGGGATSYYNDTLSSLTELYVRCYVRIPATVATNISLLTADVTSGTKQADVQITPNAIRMRDHNGSSAGTSSLNPVVGNWYRLEWHVNLIAGTQTLDIWVDPASSSAADNALSGICGTTPITVLRVGQKTATTNSVDVDQVTTSTTAFSAPPPPPDDDFVAFVHDHEGTHGVTLASAAAEDYSASSGTMPVYDSNSAVGTTSLKFSGIGYLADTPTNATTDVYVRMYVMVPALPVGGIWFVNARVAGTTIGRLRISSTGEFGMRATGSTTLQGEANEPAMLGAWYRVQWRIGGGTQTATFWEDPVGTAGPVWTLTGVAGAGYPDEIRVGNPDNAETVFIDAVKVNNDSNGPVSGTKPQKRWKYFDGTAMQTVELAGYWDGTAWESIDIAAVRGAEDVVVNPPPPPSTITRFRAGSPYERQLPDDSPVHASNQAWLDELDRGLTVHPDDGGFTANYNGKSYLRLVGSSDQGNLGSTGDFSVGMFRVTSADPNYHLNVAGNGMARFKPGGQGIRISEVAKSHYLAGVTSSDSPMMIYDEERGYYSWISKIVWEEGAAPMSGDADTTGRWTVQVGGFAGVYLCSSYGVTSATEDAATKTQPVEWPATLQPSGRAPVFYQDNNENYGHRGCNSMARHIDYDRVYSEKRLNYVSEMFAWMTSADILCWPLDGAENKTGIIKEGARLRIKSSVNVAAKLATDVSYYGSPTSRTTLQQQAYDEACWIALGMQKFGMVVGDNSGGSSAVKLEATHKEGRGPLWKIKTAGLRILTFQDNWEFLPEDYDPI